MAKAVEEWNKTHTDSRMFVNAEGQLCISTYNWGHILEDGTVKVEGELK